jgi:hypothetical protein
VGSSTYYAPLTGFFMPLLPHSLLVGLDRVVVFHWDFVAVFVLYGVKLSEVAKSSLKIVSSRVQTRITKNNGKEETL